MPLVQGRFPVQRFPGKGGWTYVLLPPLALRQNLPFGWVVVDGVIDEVPLRQVKLMGMGGGRHFLALNAALRKRLKKGDGDEVLLRLEESVTTAEVPDELLACFAEAPKKAYTNWLALPATTRKQHLDRIYATADLDRRAERIVVLLASLSTAK